MIFSLKTKVIGGRGCLEQLGETVEGFGVKKALLCTDAFLAGTPATSRIVEMLERRGIRCPVYTRLQPEPIDVHCDEGARFCAENGVELIVALGGGSVMDQSKAMAAIVTNGLPVRQLEDRPIPKRMLPLVCVPTTAGTGSEVTFVSVITNTDEQRKMTIMDADSLSPDVAICDPELLTTLPRGLIASCGVDALTHAIESFTSLPANPISDALALRAMELIAANLPRCWQDPSDLQAQGSMMLASTMAGAAFINADVGAVHALAETVGAFFHIPHGVANSLFLPYIRSSAGWATQPFTPASPGSWGRQAPEQTTRPPPAERWLLWRGWSGGWRSPPSPPSKMWTPPALRSWPAGRPRTP